MTNPISPPHGLAHVKIPLSVVGVVPIVGNVLRVGLRTEIVPSIATCAGGGPQNKAV